MLISARQIELFKAAYTTRSVSRAADMLSVSQPSVSRAVSEIETEIGVKLFDRSGRKFEPTSAGHSLHRLVLQHFHGLERIRQSSRSILGGTGGYLRLAALPSISDTIVTRSIGNLMTKHQDLRIDLEVMAERQCLAQLRAGEIDCAVVSTNPRDPNLASEFIGNLTPVVVVPDSDQLAHCKELELPDLADRELIMLPPTSPFRTALEQQLDRHDVPVRVRCEARTQSSIIELVQTGVGIAIVAQSETTGRIRQISLKTDLRWPVRLVASNVEMASPVVTNLVRQLRSAAATGA